MKTLELIVLLMIGDEIYPMDNLMKETVEELQNKKLVEADYGIITPHRLTKQGKMVYKAIKRCAKYTFKYSKNILIAYDMPPGNG